MDSMIYIHIVSTYELVRLDTRVSADIKLIEYWRILTFKVQMCLERWGEWTLRTAWFFTSFIAYEGMQCGKHVPTLKPRSFSLNIPEDQMQ